MSATPISTGHWSSGIDAAVKKKLDLWGKPLEADVMKDINMFFSVKNTDLLNEYVLTTGDLGPAETFTGNVSFGLVKENYKKTITMEEKAKGTSIQRKLVRTQQVNVVESILKALSQSLPLAWISSAYSWANLGFSTYKTGDGLSLFNAAHTSNVGGSNQSNLGSSELSYSAVDATVIAMAKFNSPNDNPLFDRKPDAIWVPTNLLSYASEIVGSKGKPDAVTNNTNYYYGKFDIIESRVISDTNNWGMLNKDKMKEAQYWFWVDKSLSLKDNELSTLVARYVKYTFYGFGCADPFWCYGHAVS